MTAPAEPDALAAAWAELTADDPHLWIRDAAARLGTSEAQLLATRCGRGVERLRVDLPHTLPRLEGLGRLLALTRNDAFVQERSGVYRGVHEGAHVTSVAGPEIELRIFPRAWRHAFAQTDHGAHGPRLSLHFFDARGAAVHKVHSTSQTDQEAFRALVDELLHPDQGRAQTVEPVEGGATHPPARPDADVNATELEAGWRALDDTHAFEGLLRRLGVGRTQALRLVSDELARPTPVLSLRPVLEGAARDALPLVLFVRSPGAYQIHHGPVVEVKEAQGWFNVLDPDFNLHVLESAIGSAWVVRKPVEGDAGWVTSIEFYDDEGETLALIFGGRGRGEPEDLRWTRLLEGLPRS